jgi:hypothetical protein
MENRLQTSFMPKRPVVGGGMESLRQKSPPSFLMIIGVVVFVITLAGFGGMYWYKGSITASNEVKKQQIQDAIKNFEPELTKQLTVLKTRIDSGKQLLGNHIAFSSVLGLLESITTKTVRFTEMTFDSSTEPQTKAQKVSIAMKGESQNYAAVAFQSDLFAKNENIKSAVFSDLNLNDKGMVVFTAKADIIPSSILYKKTLPETEIMPAEEALVLPPTTVATTTASTTPAKKATTTRP